MSENVRFFSLPGVSTAERRPCCERCGCPVDPSFCKHGANGDLCAECYGDLYGEDE